MTATPGFPEHGGFDDRLKYVESQISKLNRMRRLESASIGAGGIRVLNGGQIVWIAADGTTHLVTADQDGILIAGAPVVLDADGLDIGSGLVVVDASGVQVGNAPVVIDADGLDIGAGLTVIDSTGVQVGSDVVIDSTGLHVAGGDVQSVWFASAEDDATNVSLTTTETQFNSLVIDPPAWVEQITIFGICRAHMVNASGGTQNLLTRITLDSGGSGSDPASGIQSIPDNSSGELTVPEEATITLTPAGRSVTVIQTGWLNVGTNSNNVLTMKVLAFGVRTGFV
jgi:hypothetical protein